MATTSIWAIKGNTFAIQRVESYIENPEKTCTQDGLASQYQLHQIMTKDEMLEHEYRTEELEQEVACYVTGINCTTPNEAWKEFTAVYDGWEKPCTGRVCYHGYQSFAADEVNAEQAHTIGTKLAERLWGDRFQVVVATHLNTGHYHNHFMLNAISFCDGKKFVNRKSDYRKMREVSDELCLDYGLSVIANPRGQGKHYGEWKAEQDGRPTDRGNIRMDLEKAARQVAEASAEKTFEDASKDMPQSRVTVRGNIRADMDESIAHAAVMQELIQQMEAYGYTWNFNGKYPKIKPPGKEHYFRLNKLGNGYDSLETLARRVLDMQVSPAAVAAVSPIQKKYHHYRYHGKFKKRKKATGFLALYYYHCYRIGAFHKRHYPKYSPEFRAAQKQLHDMTKAAVFLQGSGIRSLAALKAYQTGLQQKQQVCMTQIAKLQQLLLQSSSPEENKAFVQQLEERKQQQEVLFQQQRLCKLVQQQQPTVQERQKESDAMQL